MQNDVQKIFLVGDVGGTKTNLAITSIEDKRFTVLEKKRYQSNDFGSLIEIIADFLKDKDYKLSASCLAVPGPVANGKVRLTNLPWEFDETTLTKKLNIPIVKLINDLGALAYAIHHLTPAHTVPIHGELGSRYGSVLVIAPGTGLGQASAYKKSELSETVVFQSEGGHADFAPTTELQIELLSYMKNNIERVSVERISSGYGLVNIYNFLKNNSHAEETAELAKRMASEDKGKVIVEEGLAKSSLLCEKTLQIFIETLASHIGNMVLTYMPSSGVYLGGGIPPKIIDLLKSELFQLHYQNKGRLSPIVAETPISVIIYEDASIIGSTNFCVEALS